MNIDFVLPMEEPLRWWKIVIDENPIPEVLYDWTIEAREQLRLSCREDVILTRYVVDLYWHCLYMTTEDDAGARMKGKQVLVLEANEKEALDKFKDLVDQALVAVDDELHNGYSWRTLLAVPGATKELYEKLVYTEELPYLDCEPFYYQGEPSRREPCKS